MTVEGAWQLLDRQWALGRFPGYAAAIKHGEQVSIRVGGILGFDDPRPVRPDTQFRIASLTKIVAGALALNLVADGLLALEDSVGRWLPELADPLLAERITTPLAMGSTAFFAEDPSRLASSTCLPRTACGSSTAAAPPTRRRSKAWPPA